MMLMRTVKSCGSDAPGLASSLREDAQATVTTKPGHRGEREVSRKTIAQGRPGLFRCTCGDYARVSISLHTRLRVQWAPGFPCALCSQRGKRTCKTRAKSRRGIAESCPVAWYDGYWRKERVVYRGPTSEGACDKASIRLTAACGRTPSVR